MDASRFLAQSDAELAAELQEHGEPCWAIAMGGTRRAYIAAGGTLAGMSDLPAYFAWSEAAQCAVIDRLIRLGVRTLIAVVRLPDDRGPNYRALAREALRALGTSPVRRELYQQHQLSVRVAGDHGALACALDAPEVVDHFSMLAKETAHADGARLVYLFRGPWIDMAAEEAMVGYQLGTQLGRPPSRAELIRAYYGDELPPLSVYVGSGRPQLGQLRPPFLGGAEDCYWAQPPLMRLTAKDWRRIIFDHLFARRTDSARRYPTDGESREMLVRALTEMDGQIVGLGVRHPLGFWAACEQATDFDNRRNG
jgi:hypothetical protein